jgi:serine/threonine-protein kinase
MKMVMDHVQTDPVPPSQRTELEIPPALEEAVMACLEKEPSNRPKDADDLERRLTSVDLAESWTTERAEKWWRVHLPEYAQKPASQSLEEERR